MYNVIIVFIIYLALLAVLNDNGQLQLIELDMRIRLKTEIQMLNTSSNWIQTIADLIYESELAINRITTIPKKKISCTTDQTWCFELLTKLSKQN